MTGYIGVLATCKLKPTRIVISCDPGNGKTYSLYLGGIQPLARRAISASNSNSKLEKIRKNCQLRKFWRNFLLDGGLVVDLKAGLIEDGAVDAALVVDDRELRRTAFIK